MKKSEYPIAVIDEQKDQLSELRDAFQQADEHCMTIQYDPMYSEEPYTGIELLFLDVNLNPAGGQGDKAIYGILESAIKSYIAEDNGPYVLIFWTTRPELVDGFKDFLTRDKTSTVYHHRPIYVDTLPKDDFQARPKETLELILNKPIVKLVFSLHKNLQDASTGAFKELMSCIPLPEIWGENDDYLENLRKVFTKIAITSVGKYNASIIPDKAIFEVVGREVLHHLVKNSRNEWKTFLDINEAKVDEAKNVVYQDWQYRLNTIFHVEAGSLNNIDRGSVLTGKKWVFDSFLGVDLNEWYKYEFKTDKTQDDDYRIIPVAVEISPACDYAQGSPRLYKYVLGLCRISRTCPSKNIEKGDKEPFKKKPKHKVLPTFIIGDKYYKMVLSYNYVIGLESRVATNLDYLFTLREEIVNQISSSVSDYCSRIGIIDINEL